MKTSHFRERKAEINSPKWYQKLPAFSLINLLIMAKKDIDLYYHIELQKIKLKLNRTWIEIELEINLERNGFRDILLFKLKNKLG